MNMRLARVCLLGLSVCCVTIRGDRVDDASTDGMASYVRSAVSTFNQGAVVWDESAYVVSVTGTNFQAWHYPAKTFHSGGAGFEAKLWVEGIDAPETTEDRTHYFLTWGLQTSEPSYHDPANNYAFGYTLRCNGRQNFTWQGGNSINLRQKVPGNGGSGLYREPGSGGVTSVGSGVAVGAINPGVFYRIEWKVDQLEGLNRHVFAVYQGLSAEFTDSAVLKGIGTNVVADVNVVTDAYLGFGVQREQTAAAGPVTRIHRLEFVQLLTPATGTVLMLR